MSSVPKPDTPCTKHEKPAASGIKWIPIDTAKMNSSKLSEQAMKQSEKTDKGKQADLKVFEVRFPSTSTQQDVKTNNKSVTFQLIPLKSLPCVNVEKNCKKVHKAPSSDSDSTKFDPPTKKLRTGSQNAQRHHTDCPSCNHSQRYEDVTCTFNQHEELMPDVDEFTFYKQYSEDGMLPAQMEIEDCNGTGNEGVLEDYWFDHFSRSLGANQKGGGGSNDHRVPPEFPAADYEELEKLLTSISNDNKPNFPPVYTEARTRCIKQENKENTILLQKKNKKRQSPKQVGKQGMFDMCQPFRNKMTNVRNCTSWTEEHYEEIGRPKISSKVKNELG